MNDDDYDAALDDIEAEVSKEYERQIEALVRSIEVGRVEQSIEEDRGEVLVDLISGAAFLGVMEALRRAFLRGGRVEVSTLSVHVLTQAFAAPGPSLSYSFPLPPDKARDRARTFDFDPRRPSADGAIAAQARELAQAIAEAQRAAAQLVIQAGAMRGQPTRQTALDLIGRINKTTGTRSGGVLGLTALDAQYVENARAQLLSGSVAQMKDYLKRTRRDARFDGIVSRAIEAAQADPASPPIARRDVDRIVGRYADRLLQGRALSIAKTEATKALNGGRAETYQQLTDQGADPANIRKTWKHKGDERVRDSHREMGGQSVRVDQPFVTPRGARLNFPGDDSLGAPESETAGCRCRLVFKIARTLNV